MQCRVAASFSTAVSCSDFTGFSSDHFQREVGSFQWITRLKIGNQIISVVTTCLIFAHGRLAKVAVLFEEVQADTLVGGVVRAFSDGLDTLCLARECRDLEEEMGGTTNLTGLGNWMLQRNAGSGCVIMVKGPDFARCATAPPCTKTLSCTICLYIMLIHWAWVIYTVSGRRDSYSCGTETHQV